MIGQAIVEVKILDIFIVHFEVVDLIVSVICSFVLLSSLEKWVQLAAKRRDTDLALVGNHILTLNFFIAPRIYPVILE